MKWIRYGKICVFFLPSIVNILSNMLVIKDVVRLTHTYVRVHCHDGWNNVLIIFYLSHHLLFKRESMEWRQLDEESLFNQRKKCYVNTIYYESLLLKMENNIRAKLWGFLINVAVSQLTICGCFVQKLVLPLLSRYALKWLLLINLFSCFIWQ